MRKLAVCFAVVGWAVQAQAIGFVVSSSNAVAGGSAEFVVSLQGVSAGGAAVNNAQVDILFDTNVFYIPSDARRACQVSPSLAQLVHTETLPASPSAPAGMQRLRLNVIDTIAPLGEITEGDFYFCVLEVREDAPAGASTLTATRQNVGDTAGNVLPSSVASGVVMIAGQGGGNALQPRGGGVVGGGAPPALDIPAAGGNAPSDRAADNTEGGRGNESGSGTTTGRVADGSQPAARGAGSDDPNDAGGEAALNAPGLGDTSGRMPGSAGQADVAANAAGSAVAGATPAAKSTETSAVKPTNTKAVTPTRKVEATKTPEPTPESSSWGCQVMAPTPGSGLFGHFLVGIGIWLWRRRSR